MDEREHDERPWGSYTVIDEEPDHKVKRIVIAPGRRLSYQRHEHRAEHWFVVRGAGVVTLEGVDRPVAAGDAVDVAPRQPHRMTNTGDEDDIERLEDDFGRS